MDSNDFEIRTATPDDLPLIYSATAKSMRSSPWYRGMSPESWRTAVNGLVNDRLAADGWVAQVANPVDETTGAVIEDEIAGFVVAKPGRAVLMIYVKHAYRFRGVATMLMESVGIRRGHSLVAVLGSPDDFKLAQNAGYSVSLMPYYV